MFSLHRGTEYGLEIMLGRIREGLLEALPCKLEAEGSEDAAEISLWSRASQVEDANGLWWLQRGGWWIQSLLTSEQVT